MVLFKIVKGHLDESEDPKGRRVFAFTGNILVDILDDINDEIEDSKTEELRFLTSFQLWLGENYTTLPTNSIEMTDRAIKFRKEFYK